MFEKCFGSSQVFDIEEPEKMDLTMCVKFLQTHIPDPELLQAVIRTDNAVTLTEIQETVRYFKSQQSLDNYISDPDSLFNIAVEIIVKAKQVWRLKHSSLLFFQTLKKASPVQFEALLETLGKLCEPDHALFLKSHHIDIVIGSLNKQSQLPESILEILTTYLETENPDIVSILTSLRATHNSKLDQQATDYHLSHHNKFHALRIKTHAMHLIRPKLLLNHKATEFFLQNITEFAIEYHDYEQKFKDNYTCVEEKTAHSITDWLTTALNLVRSVPYSFMKFFSCRQSTTMQYPPVLALLDIQNDFIVKLGTTTIFAASNLDPNKEQNQTMDLSQLFLVFESAAVKAKLLLYKTTNRVLLNNIKAIMLITGVCDKNPAAMYHVVEMLAESSTLQMIEQHIQASPLLLTFFHSQDFKRYFNPNLFSNTSEKIDQQAFLTALTPHIRMRGELSLQSPSTSAMAMSLTNFIANCDKQYTSGMENTEFMAWFSREFDRNKMKEVFEALFFSSTENEVSGLEKEARFCETQVRTLIFTRDELVRLDWPQEIEPTAPRTDAHNLRAFGTFYNKLTDEMQRETVIKELLLSTLHNPTPAPKKAYDTVAAPSQIEKTIVSHYQNSNGASAIRYNSP